MSRFDRLVDAYRRSIIAETKKTQKVKCFTDFLSKEYLDEEWSDFDRRYLVNWFGNIFNEIAKFFSMTENASQSIEIWLDCENGHVVLPEKLGTDLGDNDFDLNYNWKNEWENPSDFVLNRFIDFHKDYTIRETLEYVAKAFIDYVNVSIVKEVQTNDPSPYWKVFFEDAVKRVSSTKWAGNFKLSGQVEDPAQKRGILRLEFIK